VWEFDNPGEDVKPIQLGEVYPSSLQAEEASMRYAQRAVGLSDSQMGFADSTMKSRDTWRGREARVEEGDSILGSIVSGLRDTISEIGMLVWMQCVANRDRVVARERAAMRLGDEELGMLEELLGMELSEVPTRMAFAMKTTDADRTYEQQRQNMMALGQIYGQFAQQALPLAMQVYSPQGVQLQQAAPEAWNYMARILTGYGKLAEETFKFFGVYDVANFVPDSEKLDQMLDMMRGMMNQTAQSFQGAPGLGPTGTEGPAVSAVEPAMMGQGGAA
jgi:hypothetical protein